VSVPSSTYKPKSEWACDACRKVKLGYGIIIRAYETENMVVWCFDCALRESSRIDNLARLWINDKGGNKE